MLPELIKTNICNLDMIVQIFNSSVAEAIGLQGDSVIQASFFYGMKEDVHIRNLNPEFSPILILHECSKLCTIPCIAKAPSSSIW